MKLRPLHDWALIRPREAEERTRGGLVIPDAARQRPHEGEVLAVGEGRTKEERDPKGNVKEKKFVKTTLKPGDRVLYDRYSERKIEVDGKELVLVREEDVLGYMDSGRVEGEQ